MPATILGVVKHRRCSRYERYTGGGRRLKYVRPTFPASSTIATGPCHCGHLRLPYRSCVFRWEICLASLALAHRRAVSLLRGMLYPPSNSEGSDSLYLYAATILATSVSLTAAPRVFLWLCVVVSPLTGCILAGCIQYVSTPANQACVPSVHSTRRPYRGRFTRTSRA